MTEISDSLRLLFETTLDEQDDHYTVSIPKELVDGGSLSADGRYRVALLSAGVDTSDPGAPTEPTADQSGESSSTARRDTPGQAPPVVEGETRSVTIDTLGDQGDGIAKVERGFIVIVPDTQPGDQVDVEIVDVRENVAFAEPVGEATVR